mmetsp:Transcript_18098/g.30901  ORF Transcript_18098/g.30901 Transcript_18098/m.30901 type:complete len:279 (-) Transcript_18098:1916-2752(-)
MLLAQPEEDRGVALPKHVLGLVDLLDHALHEVLLILVLAGDDLGLVELPLYLVNELERVEEAPPVHGVVVDLAVLASHLVVVRGEHVHHVVVLVEAVDLEAALVLEEAVDVVGPPIAAKQAVELEQGCAPVLHSVAHDAVEIAHSPVPNEDLHDLGELLNEVGGCDAPDGATVDSDLAPHVEHVDEELEHALGVHLLLVGVVVGREHALLGLPVAAVVPDEDVGVAPQEEVKPVGAGRGDHALVDEGVGVAHDDGRLVQVLLGGCVLRIPLQAHEVGL